MSDEQGTYSTGQEGVSQQQADGGEGQALAAASSESYPLDSFDWQAMTFTELSGLLIFVALMANLGATCVLTLLKSLEYRR